MGLQTQQPGLLHALSWPMSVLTAQCSAVRGVSVKNTEANSTTARPNDNRQRGFTMIELSVVIGIILILSAMAIYQIGPALSGEHADSAMRQVVEQLRSARELAITNRRWVQVSFPLVVNGGVTDYQVQTTIRNSLTTGAGADVALTPVAIQRPMTFLLFAAPVTDTPDAFGNAGAIEFGSVVGGPVGGMLFDGNGQLVNGTTFIAMNGGTVFMGVAGHPETARAVTVMGTTGRIRGWSWNGTTWFQF
jgi:prepilin-type N-terminal cleavage/methylation domain-containing protein